MTTGGQKLRWCPEIRAGAKKLATSGQKLRWCPRIGAGTKKLSTGGQKLRWCPGIRVGTKNLATPLLLNWRCSTAAFSFFIPFRKAAANELIKQSCGRHLLGGSELGK
ncbi:MAG: hypothetical protein QM296_02565 [Bacillota bacterium]|nr:hypothetical protein [Bacillota bacterium]